MNEQVYTSSELPSAQVKQTNTDERNYDSYGILQSSMCLCNLLAGLSCVDKQAANGQSYSALTARGPSGSTVDAQVVVCRRTDKDLVRDGVEVRRVATTRADLVRRNLQHIVAWIKRSNDKVSA